MDIAWELSQSFVSDDQGIRTACVLPPLKDDDGSCMFRIVTGNQGGGMCEFSVPSGKMNLISYQHNHSVTALLSSWTASSDDKDADYVYVTGCKDNKIRIFNSATHELITTLEGHEKPVTSLSWASTADNKVLISGSWDGTAKIWDIKKHCVLATLPDHENSVCACGIEGDSSASNVIKVATGSAGIAQNNTISDHTVRIWSIDIVKGQVNLLHATANDHEGPIRGICKFKYDNNTTLATCSNDGSVKVRATSNGSCISTLSFVKEGQQHTPMLLSIEKIDNATNDDETFLIASSDDGQVIIWSTTTTSNPQIIQHADTVWNTLSLPNKDIATCCQDGKLRIFTRASDRYATQEERDIFTNTVKEKLATKSSGPSNDEIAKLPRWENNLDMRGKSEGQVQLFQKNGIAIAAQWSATSQTWVEVGQVMGTNESSSGMVNGNQYDHVLPIEVDTEGGGVAKLQIGYNNGENTFVAAQRFIDEHVLPQYHLSQIADYIQQRVGTQTPTIGMDTSGGSTAAATGPNAVTSGTPMASYEYLPIKTYKYFELTTKAATTTFEKMKTKIKEFNKLSDEQLTNISNLIETLSTTSRYHATKIQESELQVIEYMIQQFPIQETFPALDLARYVILHPDAIAANHIQCWSRILNKTFELIHSISSSTDNDKATAVAIPMLSMRLFANLFKVTASSTATSTLLSTENIDTIVLHAQSFLQSSNKNIRASVATVLYNVSYYVYKNGSIIQNTTIENLVTLLNTVITLPQMLYESEPLTKMIIALGTLCMMTNNTTAKDTAKNKFFLATKVQYSASRYENDANIKKAAKEVYTILA